MPYAIMVYLKPVDAGGLPAVAGYCAHAAFLDLVRSLDPGLAERLHEEGARKPFAVWMTRTRATDNAPQRQAFRLTILDDRLFPPIVGGILGRTNLRLRMGATRFVLTELATHPEAHHLAGFATYEGLRQAALPVETLALRFVTPTVFRSQKRDILWPDPRLLLQSWVRAWNAFADAKVAFDEEHVATDVSQRLRTMRQRIETRRVSLEEGVMSGFVGDAAFDLRDLTPDDRRTVATLGAFSFYSSTGRKTTMGMGQTRPASGLTQSPPSRTM